MMTTLVLDAISVMVFLGALTLLSHSANASILGSFGEGWNAGKAAALRALNSGQSYNASCPSGTGVSYCVGYHSGYFKEWSFLRGSHTTAVPSLTSGSNMTNAANESTSNQSKGSNTIIGNTTREITK